MNAQTVATYNRVEDAEILKSRLEAAGFRAMIWNESKLQRFWFMTHAEAAVKVQVDCDQFESARTWMKQQGIEILANAIRCPECGCSRVEYPQYTRKFITPIIVELFVSAGLFPKEYYCQDCQFTWPKVTQPEIETDILGWPLERGRSRHKHLARS
jgi:hypothetical protein